MVEQRTLNPFVVGSIPTVPTKRTSFRPDVIEHRLAHAVRDPLGRAYNCTAHLAERRRMMTVWADYLDKLKAEVKVIPFKKAEGA